jgi:hypothetical protein
MWERIRRHLNTLSLGDSLDDIAEDIIDFLRDTGLSEDIQYEIEMNLYGLMDHTTSSKAFIQKAARTIKKKVEEHKMNIFEEGAMFYDEDEDLDDVDTDF